MTNDALSITPIVGRLAPDFEVPCTSTPDHPESVARLSDYRDRWFVLMFYPQDFSLVCPTELSALSNRYAEFVERGTNILALSTDTVESHQRWIATPRLEGGLGGLAYPLGSDLTGDVSRAYGVYLNAGRIALRGLFIIDPNSVVQMQLVHNLSVGRRSEDIFRVLNALQVGGLCAENWSLGDDVIDAATELRPGSIVSHYRIEEKIGDGGFAVVFRAYDQTLKRPVALKILKATAHHQAPSILKEARAAAALNHPNVCTIHNIDDSEGISMIVMEFLVGQSLLRAMVDGPMPPETVTKIVRQVAQGMIAAHEEGVIHGDLKPANIFVTNKGNVKVLDFGLADRRTVRDLADSTVLLAADGSSFVGTPSYMSPEQVDGGPASAASDVFSFGLVIYELLAGRRAFASSELLQVLHEIRTVEPAQLAGQTPGPFRALLERMLRRDPRERTITMHDVQNELAGIE